ncbi:MAG: type II toxin-antitoxin system Phd/YefM family antitoxin [Actinobacteria bacterium]|nr:type II toxin-antitoxin system Phd/YefM family antitoxin [Actinomycetota bacterium]
MAIKKIKSARARDILGQLMDEAFYKGNDFIIEKGRKPMAVIIPFDEYKRIKRMREEDFKIFDEIWEAQKGVKVKDVEKDISEAIKEVRLKNKK